VCFQNGIFDLETGTLRDYQPEDYRMFKGQTVFEGGHGEPEIANELLGFLAGGDPSKLKLIRAACYLNICGIHSLPAFKSAFIIWACEKGDGGRSSLFNLVRKAAGGDAEVGMTHLSGLGDQNTLLRLRGRNYVFIEECQDTVSGRSQAIANLKKVTGGTSRIEVWEKFADKFEIEGHWLVNQAFNGLELMYGADKAILNRSVPIVTESIPDEIREAYAEDVEKQRQMASDGEASKFLRSLWEEFGEPINAAKVINEVKREFEEDLTSLVQTSDPVSDFCEEWIVKEAGAVTPVDSVLADFNKWLKIMYPTHKPKNIRTFNTDLKRLGYQVDRINQRGLKIQCLLGAKTIEVVIIKGHW
jgi:phage/plasmid-associated DNA primase